MRRKVWNQFRWVKLCPTFFKLPRCCFSSWQTVWKKKHRSAFYWPKWCEQLKHALTCVSTFAKQIQELLFNLPAWNAGCAWWMLGIALAQTVSVIKSCRMHREVQNHFTNVKHTLCENRGSPLEEIHATGLPRWLCQWPLWMWRIFGILVVKSHHMSTHPKKIASFSTAFSCDNSPAIKNLKNWTTNALRSVALPLSRSEPLRPSDSRLNLETWWSGIVLGGNDVNPQLYEKNVTNTKNLWSSNWKSIIKKFLDEASWFQGSPISVTKINTSAIARSNFVALRCCDYVVKAKEQYVDPHEPWSANFENWHPKAEHGQTY